MLWTADDRAKLWPAFVYGLAAAFGAALTELWPGSRFAMVVGGAFLLIGGMLALVTVLVYFGGYGIDWLDSFSRSVTRTKQSTAADSVKNLTADQLAVVRFTGEVSVGLRLTARGPLFMVEGTGVPLAFVKFEFLPRCGMDQSGTTHLAPIGSWNDGKTYEYKGMNYGTCRMLARRLTEYLVDNGLAVFGGGNQSAWLVGDLSAYELRRAFGMQLREPEFGGEEDWVEAQDEVLEEADY